MATNLATNLVKHSGETADRIDQWPEPPSAFRSRSWDSAFAMSSPHDVVVHNTRDQLEPSTWEPITIMVCIAHLLHTIAGLTPNSHEIIQGTAPVGSKNSPGLRNKVPYEFGDYRYFSDMLVLSILLDRWQLANA